MKAMRLEEVDEPARGELLVRMRAAGANPSDVATRSGKSHHSGHHTPPYIPGLEASGEVIGIGACRLRQTRSVSHLLASGAIQNIV